MLEYSSLENRALVKQYLLSKLHEEVSPSLLQAMQGIGKFITMEDVRDFIHPIVMVNFKGDNGFTTEEIEDFIVSEFRDMTPEVKDWLESYLDIDSWTFHNDSQKEKITKLGNRVSAANLPDLVQTHATYSTMAKCGS